MLGKKRGVIQREEDGRVFELDRPGARDRPRIPEG